MIRRSLILLPMLGAASIAPARVPLPSEPPAVLKKVIDCRAVADPQQRLACYDASVAELSAADAKRDIVVVDREQVQKTRRSLFGFNLPSLDIFGDHDSQGGSRRDAAVDEDVKEITSTLKAVGQGPSGWLLTLADGAQWEQNDDVTLGLRPKAGEAITIKRAALGSYKATVNHGVYFKVRRVN